MWPRTWDITKNMHSGVRNVGLGMGNHGAKNMGPGGQEHGTMNSHNIYSHATASTESLCMSLSMHATCFKLELLLFLVVFCCLRGAHVRGAVKEPHSSHDHRWAIINLNQGAIC